MIIIINKNVKVKKRTSIRTSARCMSYESENESQELQLKIILEKILDL